jgi:hypothetical protein
MTASEQLKALWEEARTSHDVPYTVLDALPFLIPVVEAAENIPPWPAAGTQKPRRKLAEALTALREHLEGA